MIERWLVAVRDHPDRPPATQRLVLVSLALRMDWGTGTGYASSAQLAADADCEERTVRYATRWGRDHELLIMTRRGHYITADRKVSSEWRLTQPAAGFLLASQPANGHRANRQMEASQPARSTPPSRTRTSGTRTSAGGGSAAAAPPPATTLCRRCGGTHPTGTCGL